MHALVFGKAARRMGKAARRMSPGTLRARAGTVWMWPGIALTEGRGAACIPVAADVARFWISRLHGQEANDWAVLRCHGNVPGIFSLSAQVSENKMPLR